MFWRNSEVDDEGWFSVLYTDEAYFTIFDYEERKMEGWGCGEKEDRVGKEAATEPRSLSHWTSRWAGAFSNSRDVGGCSSPLAYGRQEVVPMVTAGLGGSRNLFCYLTFKNPVSVWLACSTEGFAFLWGSVLATFCLSVLYISVGMAGKGWQGSAWCAGLPAALMPLVGLAEVWGSQGSVCVLAQCVGMYGFCGIRLLGMCSTRTLPCWWGSNPVGFVSGRWKLGKEFLSAESLGFISFYSPEAQLYLFFVKEKHLFFLNH